MVKKIILSLVMIVCCVCLLFACKKNDDKPTNDPEQNNTIAEVEQDIIKPTNTQVVKYETREIDGISVTFGLTNSSTVENIMNGKPMSGDLVIMGNYKYLYNMVFEDSVMAVYQKIDGWSVYAINKEIETTGEMKDDLFGVAIKSINYCFYGCNNLKTVEKLPSKILYANYAFAYCSKLSKINNIPSTLQSSQHMFAFCTELSSVSELPEGLLYANNMFEKCISLSGTINVPESIEIYKDLFKGTEKEIIVKGNNKNMKDIVLSYSNVNIEKSN